ncbi:lysozyme, partial [Methylobacterium sp. WL19]
TPSVRAAPPQRSTAPVSAWARLKTSLRALFGARA